MPATGRIDPNVLRALKLPIPEVVLTIELSSLNKYNHLVANLLSLHTLVTMTKALQPLLEEGHPVDMQALSTLSQYRTEHIKRGRYKLPTLCHPRFGLSSSPSTFPTPSALWTNPGSRPPPQRLPAASSPPRTLRTAEISGQSYKDFYIRKP